VNACDGAFRNIVKGALVTACRYGELTRMRAGDFNAEAGTITVRESKSGKPRHVALTDEGRALFSELTVGRSGGDLIFVRDDGKVWGHRISNGHWTRRAPERRSNPPRPSTFFATPTQAPLPCAESRWASLRRSSGILTRA
jgi:integrase